MRPFILLIAILSVSSSLSAIDADQFYEKAEIKSLSGQNFEISVISEKKVQEIFKKIARRTDIPFGYIRDGCYANAHKISHLLESENIISGKVHAEGELFFQASGQHPSSVNWKFHVAAFVMVKKNNKLIPFVIDPAVEQEALALESWKSLITQSPKAKLDKIYFTKRFNYLPDDDSNDLASFEEADDQNMQKTISDYLAEQQSSEKQAGANKANWKRNGVELLQEYELFESSLYGSITAANLEIPELSVVVLGQKDWPRNELDTLVTDAVKIWRQCSLKFSKVHVYVVMPPKKQVSWNWLVTKQKSSVIELRKMTPLKDQLIVYFIKEFSDLPDRSGYSTTKWLDGADYPKDLVNTIFIGSIVNSSPYKKDRVAASYNILAHEMYHIFTREGQHYNLPQANISNIWQTRSDLILPQTCEKVSSLDLIANLLKASKNSLSSIKQEH